MVVEADEGVVLLGKALLHDRTQALISGLKADSRSSVRIVDDPTALSALRDDWGRLRADVTTPFTSFDYVQAHLEVLADDDRPCLVAVFENGRLTALAPLVLRRRRPRRLEWFDTDGRSSALYLDEDRLLRLIDAVYALRLPLAVQTLIPGAPTERALCGRRPRGWVSLERSYQSGPSLPLDDGSTEPLMSLSRNRRGQLRRKLRRARELGEVCFEMQTSADDLERAFSEFVRIEASGWKGRAGTALAQDDPQRVALRQYLLASEVRDAVRIPTMRVGDEIAAMHLDVVSGGRLWSLKTAIDESFRDVMPGFHLYEFSIRAAAHEGLDVYEFLGDCEPVKEMWGAGPLELQRRRFYPPTPRGGVALVDEVARKGALELGRRLEERRARRKARDRG